MWWRARQSEAVVDAAWAWLTDTRHWPEWGPTVTDVRLDHEGHVLRADSTGSVRTPVGLWLRFEVEQWRREPNRREWSWRVGGIAATSHRVVRRENGCRISLGAPIWAPAYLPVLEVGVRRLARLAEAEISPR